MDIGDVVFLKSGGPGMTVVEVSAKGDIVVNWMAGIALASANLPEAALSVTNPEPKMDDDTRKLAEALKVAEPVVP